jgi:hypothetical protein
VVSTASDPSSAQVLAQVTAPARGAPQPLLHVDLLMPDQLLSGMLTQVGGRRWAVSGGARRPGAQRTQPPRID